MDFIDHRSNATFQFKISSSSERAKIDDSGNLLVGKSSTSIGTVGAEVRGVGQLWATRDGGTPIAANRLTSHGELQAFYKDGVKVGSIQSASGDLTVGTTDTGFRFLDSSEAIIPWDVTGNTNKDAAIDLGNTSNRFADLHLSGAANVGGDATVTGNLYVGNGQIFLGTADSSSGHVNAYELMTFNIDTDNDDTNRYFKWTTNASSGSGTQLMYLDESGDLTVSGNLTVQGTQTSLEVATLQVEDNNIVLNYGTGDTSGSADGAGITIQDAVDDSNDATILWNATNDKFVFSHDISVTGASFADNAKAFFGTGNDLSIFHDGSNSYVKDTGTGDLMLQGVNVRIQGATTGNNMFVGVDNGASTLYYQNNARLATTSAGIDVTGTITADNNLTIQNSSAYGSIELGGVSGGFIDIKRPFSDDYDLRLIAEGDGGVINVASGELTIQRAGSAKLATSSDGVEVTGTFTASGNLQSDDITIKGGTGTTTVSTLTFENYADTAHLKSKYTNPSATTETYLAFHTNKAGDSNGTVSESMRLSGNDLSVNGTITFAGGTTSADLNFGDNDKAVFGAGSDLSIYHDSNNSYIVDSGTGNLYINANEFRVGNADNSKDYIHGNNGAEVKLFYNNAPKLATSSTGIDVTGSITADGLTLDNNGSIIFNDPQATDTVLIGTNDNELILRTDDGDITLKTNENKQQLRVSNNGDVSLYEDTGTTAKFFWDASAERLGIGASAPGSLLELEATGSTVFDGTATDGQAADGTTLAIQNLSDTNNTFSQILFRNRNASKAVSRIASLTDSTGTEMAFVVENNGSPAEVLRLEKTGFAGLGTAAPAAKLDIVDTSADVQMRVYKNDGTKNTRVTLTADDSGAKIHYRDADNAGALRFNNNLGEVMRITANTTRVGIGTTAPATTLDVNGAITSTGTSTFDNFRLTDASVMGFGTVKAGATVGHLASVDEGIFWHTNNDYGIYRTSGNWVSPDYQQLRIKWATGIEIDGGSSYGKSGVNLVDTDLQVDGTTVLTNDRNLTNIGTISSKDVTIVNSSADSLLSINGGNDNAYDAIAQWRGNSSISTEGFEIWYDNSVGDVHLHTTYNHADAAIRFHTRTGASKATSNERFSITGDGDVNINSGALQLGGTTVIDSSRNIFNAETFNVNNSSALSGTQVYIKRKDGSTNLQRWGEGTSGASTFRFRIDQNFRFIANNGTSDNFNLDSDTGNISGVGTISSGAITTSGRSTLDRLYVTSSETASSTTGVNFLITDSVSNQNFTGVRIDHNASGSQAHTGDNAHYALFVDMDTTQTGGDTTNENRAYGIYSDVRGTGDTDLRYSIYGYSETQHSSGTVSDNVGVYGFAVADETDTGRTTNNTGGKFLAYAYNSGTGGATTHYGVYGKVLLTTAADKNTSAAVGVYGEIETDTSGTATTLSNAYVFQAQFDNDASDTTTTNAYLYYGNYAGTLPTNAYGVYIIDAVDNWFQGYVRSGTGFKISNTEVIDSSRNLVNIGTISSGAITINSGASNDGLYIDSDTAWNSTISLQNNGSTKWLLRNVGDGANAFSIYNSGGSSEAMRIDSSNNLLAGNTIANPASGFSNQKGFGYTNSTGKVEIATTANDAAIEIGKNNANDGSLAVFRKEGTVVGSIGTVSGLLTIGTSDTGIIFNDSSNAVYPWNVGTNGGSNGLLDLGVSDRRWKDLYLSGSVRMTTTSSGNGTLNFDGSTYAVTSNSSTASMTFATSSTERTRIDASGNQLWGKTSANNTTQGIRFLGSSGFMSIVRSNGTAIIVNRIDGDGTLMEFRTSGATRGSISISGSTTSYNTTSDQRLKHNIEDADDAGAIVDAIQVRKFDWIEGGEHQRYGMIAQELGTVAPEAVSVPDDAEEMQSVDYSKLVPMLVKEIQSLRARVAQLEGEN